jgi:transposase InsO family protein
MSKNCKPERERLFRYALISEINRRLALGETQSEIIKDMAEVAHWGVDGTSRFVSEVSLYRYLRSFKEHGLDGLSLKIINQKNRKLSNEFAEFLVEQKTNDPSCSVPELIKRAEVSGLFCDELPFSRSTVWRWVQSLNLPHSRTRSREDNSRRFAKVNRMSLVLCDGKHFRAGINRDKRVAIVFIDDATRIVLHVVVGTSENTLLFLRGLFEIIMKYGLMKSIYMDHGSAFTSADTASVISNLKVNLILSTVRYPQGRGKIERFNRTLQESVLRYFPANPAVNSSCRSLELEINHWVDEFYNRKIHSSFEDKKSPLDQFTAEHQPELVYPDERELRSAFVLNYMRRVSRDNVINFRGHYFEMPSGYARQNVTVSHKLLLQELCFLHKGAEIRLSELDQERNAHTKRVKTDLKSGKNQENDCMKVKTAARISFEKDFAPLTDEDGGYPSKGRKK